MDGEPVIGTRWSATRRFAGYGAASTLSLYLLVKIIWVVAALSGHGSKISGADWLLLNVVTVGMAVIGIALAMALARPWGFKIPAGPLVLVAWVGAGFLVPMIPFMLLSTALSGSGGGDDGDAMPVWEGIFISIGFVGMAVGLAIALPIYMLERFPRVFQGRLDDGRTAPPRNLPLVRVAMAVSVALGVLWLSWAFGGTFGFDTGRGDPLDRNAKLLMGTWGTGALVAAWSVHLISRRRSPRLRRWVPTVLAFAASGSLFAWNSWKLPLTLLSPGDYEPREYPAVALIEYVLAIGAGLILLTALLRAQRPARHTS
ncbi:hypothetical protein ACGFNU_04655 [Spirillospora sp. NPDC048911]|uniref:hypothetical protein n=1 Tax=Spirillospora sp. NPDC048911 TaxID=3364527 RepID=UPI003723E594